MPNDWRDHAACRGADPDLFVPQNPESPSGPAVTSPATRAALEICADCPVVDECEAFADSIQDSPVTGVWGGVYRSRRFAEQRQHLTGTGPYAAVAPRRLAPR